MVKINFSCNFLCENDKFNAVNKKKQKKNEIQFSNNFHTNISLCFPQPISTEKWTEQKKQKKDMNQQQHRQ